MLVGSVLSIKLQKNSMVRAVYQFHMYYHVRQVLKRLQVPLLHESTFNASDNPYMSEEFFKICEDYEVPHDHVKYRDQNFYWTYQHGVVWPNDYIGPDSMTHWIIERSLDFTNVGLLRTSESIRAYAYLIPSPQASARSRMIGNTASALTVQQALLNNFKNVVNRRVDIGEDIKHYQDNLSYTSNKVDYIVGENIYMLPSNMKLKSKSGTTGYNNKILISDGKFSRGRNDKVNALVLEPVMPKVLKVKKHKVVAHTNELSQKPTITHKEESHFDSLPHWWLYYVVHVSVINYAFCTY